MEFSLLAPTPVSRLISRRLSWNRDVDLGSSLLRLLSSRPRVKVARLERPCLLGDRGGYWPASPEGQLCGSRLRSGARRHPDNSRSVNGPGFETDDPGQLPDQTVDVDAVFRAAAILRSSSSLSSRWVAVSIAITLPAA